MTLQASPLKSSRLKSSRLKASRLKASKFLSSIASALCLVLCADPALAEYKLQPGDVLELRAIGAQDLNQKATIGPDGLIHFPFFGSMKAATKTQGEVLTDLRALIPSKIIQTRLPDGRMTSFVLSPDEVSLEISEYRPVYVYGYVQRPGVIVFRPNLTIRQAVSEAGGLGIETLGTLALSDLRTEYDVTLADVNASEAKLARINGELEGRETLALPSGKNRDVYVAEQQVLQADNKIYRDDITYRQTLASQINVQIADLQKRTANNEQEMIANEKDIASMKDAFTKGSIPLLHFSELRRAAVEAQGSALMSQSQLDQTVRDGLAAQRDLKRFADQHVTDLKAQQNDLNERLRQLTSRLAGQREKLASVARLNETDDDDLHIAVYRQENGSTVMHMAKFDEQIEPGDTVRLFFPKISFEPMR